MNPTYALLPAFIWLCLAAYYRFSLPPTGATSHANPPAAGGPFISSSPNHPVVSMVALMVAGYAVAASHPR